MKVLSSVEEILMLTVFYLAGEAYGVTIRKKLGEVTGKEWSHGAIYEPLYRLEKKGLVQSILSEPTQERGGRSKRMFELTAEGIEVLREHQQLRNQLSGDLFENTI